MIIIIIIIIIVILACPDARCESGQTSGSCRIITSVPSIMMSDNRESFVVLLYIIYYIYIVSCHLRAALGSFSWPLQAMRWKWCPSLGSLESCTSCCSVDPSVGTGRSGWIFRHLGPGWGKNSENNQTQVLAKTTRTTINCFLWIFLASWLCKLPKVEQHNTTVNAH